MSAAEAAVIFEQLRRDVLAMARASLAANYTRLSAEIETLPEDQRDRVFLLAGAFHGEALMQNRVGLLALELAAATALYNRSERIQ